MLSLRLYGPNDIRLEEVPVPEITSEEILLKNGRGCCVRHRHPYVEKRL